VLARSGGSTSRHHIRNRLMRHACRTSDRTKRMTLDASSSDQLITLSCDIKQFDLSLQETHPSIMQILKRTHTVCLSTNRFASSSESFSVTSSPRYVTT
jgi:hypothetical protein